MCVDFGPYEKAKKKKGSGEIFDEILDFKLCWINSI